MYSTYVYYTPRNYLKPCQSSFDCAVLSTRVSDAINKMMVQPSIQLQYTSSQCWITCALSFVKLIDLNFHLENSSEIAKNSSEIAINIFWISFLWTHFSRNYIHTYIYIICNRLQHVQGFVDICSCLTEKYSSAMLKSQSEVIYLKHIVASPNKHMFHRVRVWWQMQNCFLKIIEATATSLYDWFLHQSLKSSRIWAFFVI